MVKYVIADVSSPAFVPGGDKSGGALNYLFDYSVAIGFRLGLELSYFWAVARRLLNRMVHALNGNGPGPGDRARVASRAALFSDGCRPPGQSPNEA